MRMGGVEGGERREDGMRQDDNKTSCGCVGLGRGESRLRRAIDSVPFWFR